MTISADLFRAILAMDTYSRGPENTSPFIEISGNQLGDATLWDRKELGTATIYPKAAAEALRLDGANRSKRTSAAGKLSAISSCSSPHAGPYRASQLIVSPAPT